jgi:putative ABC transport system substrate-binding protein
MRRREFITLISGTAVAWSLPAHAQQSATPVIGFLSSTFSNVPVIGEFRGGLDEKGYVEGQNVTIVYRWAEGQYERLPALAEDLIHQRPAVIVASGSTAPAVAAAAATSTIPIVFVTGGDPVAAGLVASLNRPGRNVTGITFIFSMLVPKRLELLHELVPKAATIGALVNPNYPEANFQRRELRQAAEKVSQPILIEDASTSREIDAAFVVFAERKIDALLVANDPFFESRRDQFASLAVRHAVPAIYSGRAYVEAGGLISYGPSLAEGFRLAGTYTGRILRGEKPSDLPVQQPTKFELVINLKTAKALGVTVPPNLLALADEVIE